MTTFEWDDAKARSNLAKHGVAFNVATSVWDDPFLHIATDDTPAVEERWKVTGVAASRVLVVVLCFPDPDNIDRIRLISARRATPHERKFYEDQAY